MMPKSHSVARPQRLPRHAPTAVVICVLLLSPTWSAHTAWSQIPSYDRVNVLPSPRPVGEAELTNQDGEHFSLSSLHGRVAFVLFGFTNCPDVCPLSMERLRALHQSGALSLSDVAYVMISVDGERDTPPQLKAFLLKYSDDFIGLTGEPIAIQRIASQFSAAFFKGHADHGGKYDVAHSPQIFVLDRQGRVRAELYSASVDAMVGVANALIDEKT